MSNIKQFVIEDERVAILVPKIAEDRTDAIFDFMIEFLEAQGLDIKKDKQAINEALPSLKGEVEFAITSDLFSTLKKFDVAASQELGKMIDRGINYEQGYDFFAQMLPSWEIELAKALIAFARHKLTPAEFYTWNTFLYRFKFMYYHWMIIPDFMNDLLREQKATVVTVENKDSVEDSLYQQFYQQFYSHYFPTIGSPWAEQFTERDEKGEFPSYQSIFQYFTQWSKTLKTDLVPFLVAFREEYLRKAQEAAAALAQKEKADEERNNLTGRVQRDREKAIYTFSMSTLMTLPFTTHEDKNNQETQQNILQDANTEVIFHLASCPVVSDGGQQAPLLVKSGVPYDEIYQYYEAHLPNFAIEVAEALLAFRAEQQKQALEKKFRTIRRIKQRNYSDEKIATYVEQLHTIFVAFRKDFTGQEQFSLFFDDPEIQANFDELLDKGITAHDIFAAINKWYETGSNLRLSVQYVSPFKELIDRLLG